MRLLALHGWGQDAAVFNSRRTNGLQKKLKTLPLLLDCVDAPFQIGETSGQRGWWTYRPEDWDGSLSNPLELLSRESFAPIGLDTSLEALAAQWKTGEYDGILGFSQGAVMAAVLCAKLCSEPEAYRRPGCIVLISGFANPSPVDLSYYPPKTPLAVRSLHIWGEADTHIPPAASAALAERFVDPVTHTHPAHHFIPQKPQDCKVFLEFLQSIPAAAAGGSAAVDKTNGTALCEAVSNIDLAQVTALLDAGHCANGVRDPGGEEDFQPDRPLKMVLFRVSDCLLGKEQLATLAEIARILLKHGADPKPAMALAERRYGPYLLRATRYAHT